MAHYSLLTEPWIPVLTVQGESQIVSLRDTLLSPARFRRLDSGQPLQTAALYRLHLALLHRALLGPSGVEQAADWYRDGFPTTAIEDYLARFGERFELFGPAPFMQVAGLDPASVGENFRSHWVRLSAEEGSANTTALFNVEGRPGGARTDAISPAQAALRLLEHQSFALGGLIKRFTTSARAAPVATAALFLAEGENLHQTLALNLVPYRENMARHDLPPWELPPLDVAAIRGLYDPEQARVIPGYASRYAWLSRSVLLLPEETPHGVQVRSIGFGAGVPLELPGEGSGAGVDPMLALRPSRDPKATQPFPYKLRRGRLLWRDITALLPEPASEISGGKGKVRDVKGQPPRTLEFARELMQAVAARAPRAAVVPPSQDQPEDFPPEGTADAHAAHPVIPVVVFGQLTDQGKAFALRQESYTLPDLYIREPERFRDQLQDALAAAGRVGEGLRVSVRLLAANLLSRGGEREAHKDDVTRLSDQLPAEPTYWAQLETPFRSYLAELDRQPAQARPNWDAALTRAALAGWRAAEQAAGMNAVGLRAVQLAGRPLFGALATLAPRESA